jgi:hypothetical protein
MKCFQIAFALLLFCAAMPGVVTAQVRAGVEVDRLSPDAMSLVDVQVSVVADQPVWLVYARPGQSAPARFIDVYVGSSSADARRAFELYRESLSVASLESTRLGDSALGGGEMIAFTRDNIFVAIRDLEGQDVSVFASHIDRLIQRAPVGSSQASSRLARVESLAPEQTRTHQFSNQVLASHVEPVSDGASARRRGDGWLLGATGPQVARFHARIVDRRLRQR